MLLSYATLPTYRLQHLSCFQNSAFPFYKHLDNKFRFQRDLIPGLFGYFFTGGSPTFLLALGGVQLPPPLRSCNGPNGPKGSKS